MRTEQKHRLAELRHWRVRKKISGTKACPRMSVCFTNQNIHVQFIDDTAGVTLAATGGEGGVAGARPCMPSSPPAKNPINPPSRPPAEPMLDR